jgi:tetratricopeptide (TPR) repeat protein
MAGFLRQPGYWVWLLPVLAAIGAHLPVLGCDFVWDDIALIARHPHIGEPGFLVALFQNDYGLEFGPRHPNGYYRPGFMFLVALFYRVAGPSPMAYHALSLAIFALTTVCLVRLCRRHAAAAGPWFAMMVGLLYAVHPARTEVVSFVMSLPDLLIELGAVLAISLLLRDAATRMAGLRQAALLAALACAAAISKETGFLLMAALGGTALAAAWFRPARLPTAVSHVLGLAAGLGAAAWLRASADVAPSPAGEAVLRLFGDGSGVAVASAWYAVRDLLIPRPAVFLQWEYVTASWLFRIGIVAVAAAFASALWLALRRSQWLVAMAITWFGAGLFNLMLVSTVLRSYDQRYFAVAPGVLLLVSCAFAWWRRVCPDPITGDCRHARARRLLAAAAGLYLALFATYTLSSSATCFNTLSFFNAMAEDAPREPYPRVAIAKALFSYYGDFEGAEEAARAAIRLRPDIIPVRELGKLLATIRMIEKRPREALPWLTWAEAAIPDNAELHHLRGVALRDLADFCCAARSFNRALALDPSNDGSRRQRDACRAVAATNAPAAVPGL